jgi:hypothetical protein
MRLARRWPCITPPATDRSAFAVAHQQSADVNAKTAGVTPCTGPSVIEAKVRPSAQVARTEASADTPALFAAMLGTASQTALVIHQPPIPTWPAPATDAAMMAASRGMSKECAC